MNAEPRYIIAYAGAESPPRTLAELFSLQLSGEVDGSTLVRPEGDPELKWEKLATVRRRYELKKADIAPGERRKANLVILAVVAPFALVGIILLVGALGYLFAGPEEWRRQDEQETLRAVHHAAEQFILSEYPRAKKVSRLADSKVLADGNQYEVLCVVDGVNVFNAPVRNIIRVKLWKVGDNFRLSDIGVAK